MPSSFKKAKLNKSIYLYKEKTIYWDIDIIMPCCTVQSDCGDSSTTVQFRKCRVSEKTILRQLVVDILTSHEWKADLEEKYTNVNVINYASHTIDNIHVLFKHDSGKFYHLLDCNRSLADNFANRTIVEYPTFVIIVKNTLNNYCIK